MPIYKKPEDKAAETVTFRLTLDERRMLDHLSTVEQMTLTDLIRSLIAKRAEDLNITEVPPPKPRRRPGRPKSKKNTEEVDVREPKEAFRTASVFVTSKADPARLENYPIVDWSARTEPSESSYRSEAAEEEEDVVVQPVETEKIPHTSSPLFAEDEKPPVFGDLAFRFLKSFTHRAEGTKRELEETLKFLCLDGRDGRPIIPQDTPISALTGEYLAEIRLSIRDSEIRLAKKNLYLTYLRMMLHFGTKEPGFDLRINPSRELPPLSIVESDERRRFFTGVNE